MSCKLICIKTIANQVYKSRTQIIVVLMFFFYKRYEHQGSSFVARKILTAFVFYQKRLKDWMKTLK